MKRLIKYLIPFIFSTISLAQSSNTTFLYRGADIPEYRVECNNKGTFYYTNDTLTSKILNIKNGKLHYSADTLNYRTILEEYFDHGYEIKEGRWNLQKVAIHEPTIITNTFKKKVERLPERCVAITGAGTRCSRSWNTRASLETPNDSCCWQH